MKQFRNVFHDCNLNYDLRFFGFHADAVDHDEITAVRNKLNMMLKNRSIKTSKASYYWR
jgi:hypothetical protein